jgi:hypothetical protein
MSSTFPFITLYTTLRQESWDKTTTKSLFEPNNVLESILLYVALRLQSHRARIDCENALGSSPGREHR